MFSSNHARAGAEVPNQLARYVLRKLPHTHRYFLTSRGREITSALLLAQRVTSEQLRKAAA